MTGKSIKYFDLIEARAAYSRGENITELLRTQKGVAANTAEIIETAYDLQAGTYIEYVRKNMSSALGYAGELAQILGEYLTNDCSLLDVGTGELTTLSLILKKLNPMPNIVYAFDVSWSRVWKGMSFAKLEIPEKLDNMSIFVADMAHIPLLDKSVDFVTSSHALEPNGGSLNSLLKELFRVTREKLILFEPCYEINSEEGKARMDRLGYIKGMDQAVESLGGKILRKIKIENISNPLNPTVCFIIEPPIADVQKSPSSCSTIEKKFAIPGSNVELSYQEGFYFSRQTGLAFPILKGIPVFKPNAGILASSMI